MSELLVLVIFLVIGYFSGILVGLMGIGGGLVFVPVLYYFLPLFNIPQDQLAYFVIGTSMFAGSLASLSSGTLHIRAKNVVLNKAFLLAFGSVLSAFIAPFFIVKIESRILQLIFAAVFTILAIKMLLEHSDKTVKTSKIKLENYFLPFFGILIGTVSAFTGIGGGILYVPTLILLYGVDPKPAVGTSSVVTSFTMVSSTASFFLQSSVPVSTGFHIGYIYLSAGIPLGLGAIAGSFLGVKFAIKASSIIIKKIFSVLLIVVVLRIIFDLW